MTCGGNLLRTSQQPLARLVDSAAARWLSADGLPAAAREALRREIATKFPLGDLPALTLHGLDFTLTLEAGSETIVSAHQIEREN